MSGASTAGRGESRCRRFVDRGLVGGGCLDVLAVGGLAAWVGLLLCPGGGGGAFLSFFLLFDVLRGCMIAAAAGVMVMVVVVVVVMSVDE